MCYGQLGQYDEAYEDYVAAIDLLDDPVRMRCLLLMPLMRVCFCMYLP